jgi:putative phosphoesterase
VRVAALYDIHGNLPALSAVLADIEREGIETVVIGGDIAWGPFPSQTVVLLQTLHAYFIRGNADREVAEPSDATDDVAQVTRWCAERLTPDQRAWLNGLAVDLSLEIEGLGSVLFCHGSPRSDEESLTHLTPEERLRSCTAGVNEPIVVCGHTHIQFDRRVDGRRVVNAGSVGLPYQGARGAFWAILGPDVELRRTEYDVDSTTRLMGMSACPHVDPIFVDALTNPPDADETARHFEGMEQGRTWG